uniref:Uncharacterized protein n=1 Tax=Rhizophagus irregularis (strain DAOM 181602 / DAOM 197198 / MUCL 43194) TaxID=747089 RepID=U9V537_RHIID
MGTRGVILIRTRKPKRKEMSVMGEPAGSQYFYEYYVCIYQHFDGYVKGGLGEWLANFLYEFTHNLSTYPDTGLLATRLIEGLYSKNNKSFAEISYDDDEVEKNGYLSEDQLLIKFLKEIP